MIVNIPNHSICLEGHESNDRHRENRPTDGSNAVLSNFVCKFDRFAEENIPFS